MRSVTGTVHRDSCSKEIQGEHQWDENINSFLGMDISYIDCILSMSVKAKTDDLFKKYPFLASGSRWSQSTSSSEVDNPPSLDDGELSDYHREIRFKIPRDLYVSSIIYYCDATHAADSCHRPGSPEPFRARIDELRVASDEGHRAKKSGECGNAVPTSFDMINTR